ncbi:hypothetical protein N0V84_012711 [Fusarium piperis]|uniref:Protein kinase domain-containing protein n=1 Tax=Fusarium piperis TaxID=1435070 RepID=A0A9W8T9M6_9HYPO|nr:hypothetical protein N0V84_012711 [Fusarium piperis]
MGAGGSVYSINDTIAFKCANVYDNPQPSHAEDIAESAEKAAHEQEIYKILMANPHPFILRGILLIPEGIFMERMVGTLYDRIKEPVRSRPPPPPSDLERRWILQLSSAVAWLETLGLAHGDLRPKNILLASNDDIRVADFDVTRRVGEEVYTVTAPFGKMNPGWKHPIAGPGTEQFALASCIYNIRFGEEPMSDIDGPEMVQMLMRGELPPRPDDGELGDLLVDCWSEKFESIAAVDEKLRKLFGAKDCVAPVEDSSRGEMLLADCHRFLEKEKFEREKFEREKFEREKFEKEKLEKEERQTDMAVGGVFLP